MNNNTFIIASRAYFQQPLGAMLSRKIRIIKYVIRLWNYVLEICPRGNNKYVIIDISVS